MSLALLARPARSLHLRTASRHPLLLLVLLQLLLWTAVPVFTYRALPLDVVEGVVWGRAWQWGYSKHPPLSSWLLAAVTELPGGLLWGPYLLSQLAIAATYLAAWGVGRSLLPPRPASLGVLLLCGVYYFSAPTPEFNHNLLQMPFWALSILCYRRALLSGRPAWWLALGVAAALALLTKYAAAVLLATMGLHLLLTREGREALRSPGPWLALAAAIALLLPHLHWLLQADFAPFAYARMRARPLAALERLTVPLGFLLAQLLDHAGLLAILAAAGLGRFPAGRESGRPDPWPEAEAWRFLLWFSLGPLALLLLASAFLGFGLRDMWGAPFFSLSGFLAVALCRSQWRQFRRGPFAAALIGVLLLVPAVNAATTLWGGSLGSQPRRVDFPVAQVRETAERLWRAESSRPLRFLVGDEWLAGTLSLTLPDRPQVLLYGDPRRSPWIAMEALERVGALVVWDAARSARPPAWAERLPRFRPLPPTVLPWPKHPAAAPLRLGWGLLLPAP